jgi:hypothetical protein
MQTSMPQIVTVFEIKSGSFLGMSFSMVDSDDAVVVETGEFGAAPHAFDLLSEQKSHILSIILVKM